MNKEVNHKFMSRKVVLLYNNKELIGYELKSFTPNYKRVLYSLFTVDRMEAKRFLNLMY